MGVSSAIAKAAPTHRQCGIEISNDCSAYTLCNPRMYTSSGRCTVPLPVKINPSSTGNALFTKTPYTARGTVGIFTYDLLNNSTNAATEQIGVMFKVPFDLNLKSNVYAVGVFDISKECIRDLYREMSKTQDAAFVRGKAKGPVLTHKGQSIAIVATMSNCYEPVIKVQVSEEKKVQDEDDNAEDDYKAEDDNNAEDDHKAEDDNNTEDDN
ncbi:DELTA-actitoxin-Ucs1a-like [Chelmon rostratus]|uniref:DELTA-actitoxin-Ucs1a-like n=1 Tax=Chelmon rostratus TaxID=109905 RepID=UPI001BE57AC2|nr:DELTA-actitoxin-Ucs1a-like [Chelmon rostratus]